MCGIAGYININGEPIKSNAINRKMLAIQKHRGPDDSGIRAFSLKTKESKELSISQNESVDSQFNGILGFNRLSILDLTPAGHQPMTSDDGQVVLALNGEVYNVFDYKPRLNYPFKGTSDTEVVLALYLEYGLDGMLSRLNGMFAIVIVDFRISTTYIIRDRLGIKPMYYLHTNDILAFSSEFKSFYCLDNFSYQLDESQLNEYLLFRTNVSGTLLKGIESLEPGQYLSYHPEKGVQNTSYFNVNSYSRQESTDGIEQYKTALSDSLSKSVNRQLMSDVKLGCQLSGGVDSSLVTYLANKTDKGNLFESVSIIFDDHRFSEEKFIDYVTDKLDIESHKFLLDDDYYLKNIQKATFHFESPINHPNTIGIFLLAQRAKEYVTVLLSGEGADEVFGGYSRFNHICNPWKAKYLVNHIAKTTPNLSKTFDYLSADTRAIMATSFMPLNMADQLVKTFDVDKALESRKAIYSQLKGSIFDKQVKYEIQTYLPDLLIRQDKMSMAHSIENRVPFLDNDVLDASFRLPERLLMPQKGVKNSEKYLLKLLTADVLGEEFSFRDKMGFGIPLKQFFANNFMKEYLRDEILPSLKRRGIFNYQLVERWVNNIKTLKYNEIESLWIVVAFEIWALTYLDGKDENWHS
ncbi:MAG: asparagine synthase (glutamine-hydrolyzing) [Bacteroidales bacterium]|nr:asparagine synthase (glutamine-hydrolyzing) [Bacteroidales bacterium]